MSSSSHSSKPHVWLTGVSKLRSCGSLTLCLRPVMHWDLPKVWFTTLGTGHQRLQPSSTPELVKKKDGWMAGHAGHVSTPSLAARFPDTLSISRHFSSKQVTVLMTKHIRWIQRPQLHCRKQKQTCSWFSVSTSSVRLSQLPMLSGRCVSLFWSAFKIESFWSFPANTDFYFIFKFCRTCSTFQKHDAWSRILWLLISYKLRQLYCHYSKWCCNYRSGACISVDYFHNDCIKCKH